MELTFVKVFVDFLDALEPLGDAERGRLFTAMLEYARTGTTSQLSGNERFLFPMVRAQIDRDRQNLEELSHTRSEAGKKGGRPRKQEESKKPNAFRKSKKSYEEDKDNDKEKDKEEKEGSMSRAAPAHSVPAVMHLPLNTGSFGVTQADIDHWAELYPAVDIQAQLRKMIGWLEANPTRRKTKSGIRRFVTTWLAKEQDKGAGNIAVFPSSRTPLHKPSANKSYDIEDLEELSHFDLPEGL